MNPAASFVRHSRRRFGALRPIALTIATLALAACGGGGGGDEEPPPPPPPPPAVQPQSISGSVIDGYVAGATVECRKAGTLVATATSGASGGFAFALASGQTCDTIVALGGVDVGVTPNDPSDDVTPPTGFARAPVPTGSTAVTGLIVSPLSTLVQALIDGGRTSADAQALVKTSLGLSAGIDLLRDDPAANAVLYRANGVVAQLVGQLVDALAAAGGIGSAAGLNALADASFDALAARLASLKTADLAPLPGSLTPSSPLFGLVELAASNAKKDAAVSGALASLNPATFAALASPIVASATGSINTATDIADVVTRVNRIEDRDRATSVIGALRGLLDNAASNPQQALNEIAAKLAAADGGTDQALSITIDSETLTATVAGGLSNFAQLVNDQLTLKNPLTSPVAPLSDFESVNGATVPQELVSVGFALQKSAVNAQLSATPMEAPLAIEVTDATRVFQAYIDRVAFKLGVGDQVEASLPSGARLWVYGKTASSETTSPLIVNLAGTGLQIVSTTGGTIAFSFDKLFEVIGSAAASGSALDVLAASRVSSGTYDVKLVLGTLRIARSTPTPALATLQAFTLRAGGQSVTGHGFKGKVKVTP